jgi:hypothetical protein
MKICYGLGAALVVLGVLALNAYSLIEGAMHWYKMYDRFFCVFWWCAGAMLAGVFFLIVGFCIDRWCRPQRRPY